MMQLNAPPLVFITYKVTVYLSQTMVGNRPCITLVCKVFTSLELQFFLDVAAAAPVLICEFPKLPSVHSAHTHKQHSY